MKGKQRHRWKNAIEIISFFTKTFLYLPNACISIEKTQIDIVFILQQLRKKSNFSVASECIVFNEGF